MFIAAVFFLKGQTVFSAFWCQSLLRVATEWNDRHMDVFLCLALVNSAAMNNGIHESFSILASLRCMPWSGISESYGGFISSFFKKSPYHLP